MKKGMLVGSVVTLMVIVLALGIFGFASAQTPVPNTPFGGRGGMMGGRGGMMGGQGMLGGAMHPYMVAAAAEALDMTEADLNAELTAGKTLWQVAAAQGKTADEIPALLQGVHTQALAAMLADGVITQQQADWMQTRMGGMYGQGGGRGGCPMQGGLGGYGRGRWNTTPAQPTTGG